jgi:SAM-dependent methyltransferase
MRTAARPTSLQATLEEQERIWQERPVLRRLYRDWYRLIRECVADVPGPIIELGAGTAHFKDACPQAIATDVEPTSWAEEVVDAQQLPYSDGSVANLILIDVFHHLARPARFFDECSRVLVPGGRVVILDPYCSTLSTLAYEHFHHEDTDLDVPPLADASQLERAALASNQARATLVFFRAVDQFRARWPELRIVVRRRLSFLLYPLSGGYSKRALVPAALYRPLSLLERVLQPLAPVAAFRCLVVLERR